MSKTPLNDFLASLADPITLDRFRADPIAIASAFGLSEDQIRLVAEGNLVAIRFQAVQELEVVGLAPMVTNKLGVFDPTN